MTFKTKFPMDGMVIVLQIARGRRINDIINMSDGAGDSQFSHFRGKSCETSNSLITNRKKLINRSLLLISIVQFLIIKMSKVVNLLVNLRMHFNTVLNGGYNSRIVILKMSFRVVPYRRI